MSKHESGDGLVCKFEMHVCTDGRKYVRIEEYERLEEEIARWKLHSNSKTPDEISKALDGFNRLVDELRDDKVRMHEEWEQDRFHAEAAEAKIKKLEAEVKRQRELRDTVANKLADADAAGWDCSRCSKAIDGKPCLTISQRKALMYCPDFRSIDKEKKTTPGLRIKEEE